MIVRRGRFLVTVVILITFGDTRVIYTFMVSDLFGTCV